MPIFKTYNLCEGEAVYDLLPAGSTNFQNVPAIAAVFPFLSRTQLALTILGNTTGAYSFTFQVGDVTYTVQINVSSCLTEFYDNCCDNQCNIAWLNPQGGWQNYIFTGIKTFEVDQDNGNTFKTSNKTIKWSERKEVYEATICTTGNIPKAHVDYLDSLRYSVQAFLFNPATNAFDIPILVDSDSFTKYTSRQKLFDISIRFLKAKEIQVQTQ
jgi:hypothetical protein